MRITLSTKHFLTWSSYGIQTVCWDTVKDRLDPEAWVLLTSFEDETATHVALANDQGRLVGWFRCSKIRQQLFAQGTWVAKNYRRQGIGRFLWLRALRTLTPKRVFVDTVSAEGQALVASISRDCPGIIFDRPV